jgi:hypothetical protein
MKDTRRPSDGTWMTSPPYTADELKWAGFNLVSRTNTHAMDNSVAGMRVTTTALDRAGIGHAGVGESLAEARLPTYIETKGGRVALISAASTFPTRGAAGEGRHGMSPRLGLNTLTCNILWNRLKLGGETERDRGKDWSPSSNRDGLALCPWWEIHRIRQTRAHEEMHGYHLSGNLRSVKDVRLTGGLLRQVPMPASFLPILIANDLGYQCHVWLRPKPNSLCQKGDAHSTHQLLHMSHYLDAARLQC